MKTGMSRAGEKGFGMIEVLVAILVLAIGVLGFAGLQARAVQASGESYYRTQAMSIAQDLAERFRVNSSASATYLLAGTWSTTVAAPNCFTADTCTTAAKMAAFDAENVRNNAATLLPQGQVLMENCIASSMRCIYVSWDGLVPGAGVGKCVDGTTGKSLVGATCAILEVM